MDMRRIIVIDGVLDLAGARAVEYALLRRQDVAIIRFDDPPLRLEQDYYDAMLDFERAVKRIKSELKIAYRAAREAAVKADRRPREIPESQFKKPTFTRRACGGRWRVMRA